MMRIGLFLLTNLAVILLASITLSLLGFEGYMQANGVDLNLQGLLVFCFIFGMAGAFISLLISKWMAKRFTGTQIISEPRNAEEKWLLDTVAELAERAGIGMPEVGVFPAEQSNAFATGWNRNDALVAVSAGLMRRFNKDEIRAVLAHEVGHVANGDMVTLALIQGVMNTFVMFFARIIGHTVDRVVFKTERGHGIGFYVVTFIAEIILGILAAMIVAWFSRKREYRADEMGAQLAGKQAMISALAKLKAETEVPNQMPDTMTAFGITEGKLSMASLLASHPPLEQRIKVLQNAS